MTRTPGRAFRMGWEAQNRLRGHEPHTEEVLCADSSYHFHLQQHKYRLPLGFNCFGFWGFQWAGHGDAASLEVFVYQVLSFIRQWAGRLQVPYDFDIPVLYPLVGASLCSESVLVWMINYLVPPGYR